MRVGYIVGYGPAEMRYVENIEAVQGPTASDGQAYPYLRLTFKPEPGVDDGKTVDAVGMYWVDKTPVFYAPENW